jgi:hypothetical protein
MAKETPSADASLPLHEVLEGEFRALHGELPTDYPSSAEPETRLRALRAAVHGLKEKRAALCISGGGIRSATFGLGVLQGLARCGLLDRFHYLSTVSGGGYIGSWLSAWIKNHPQGIVGVVAELKSRPDSTLVPEPQPIRHLREFSNYLTPKTGLTSVDFWTLIATFARNMFLNWLVLISCLAAAMMIPRLCLAAINLQPDWSTWTDSSEHRWDIGLTILLAVGFALLAVAMAYAIIDVPSTGNARLPQGRFLKFRQLPLLLASLIFAEWWAVFRSVHGSEPFQPSEWLLKFVAFMLASYLCGELLATVVASFRKREQRPWPDRVLRFVFIVVSAAVAGLCLWAMATRLFLYSDPNPTPAPTKHVLNYVCFAPALLLAVPLLVNFLFTGLASRVTKDEDREWWGRSAAWILITIFGWIAFNVMVLWGAQAIAGTTKNQLGVFLGQPNTTGYPKALLGAFGGVTGIAGALLALRRKLSNKLGQKGVLHWLLVVVAVVFFVLLSIVISWVLVMIRSHVIASLLRGEQAYWRVELFVGFFVTAVLLSFGIVMGFFINANKFSLHATYRNRLIRAYLGASRPAGTRKPNLFTGFDPDDNFELHKLSSEKPLHVINAALNLVKGEELAWQERKAESFTMSRLHCGSWHVGYRLSTKYGKGISLGTAFAISGAAANPNMGYHSSPVVEFLMTLFNVRLGWWLGNPGPPGTKTWHRSGPRYSVGPLFSEAMGNTTDNYKYVNLSDGGHFENLGLYEMVLRRCHYIVVSDAGEDPECSFADLGEAVRKIRIDFGIPIEFAPPIYIYTRSDDDARNKMGRNCAIGSIQYSAVDGTKVKDDGVLIYIKPACYGQEPRDIYEYFKRNPLFPHESTVDQFFTESQFESYRMLGVYTMQNLCKKPVKNFQDFIEEIQKYLTIAIPSPVSGPLPPQTAVN